MSAGSRWITETSAPHWLEVRLAREEPIDTVDLYQYRGYELTDVLGSRGGRARLYELELTCRNTGSSCDS